VTKLLQLYDALGDAQRIHHLRLSELTHRLLDLSCASIQRLRQGEVATTGTSLGHGLLGTPDAALLEAADELQQLLMEGHQLLVELLLGVWGPQVSEAFGSKRVERCLEPHLRPWFCLLAA
jgi:hypothetical protein